MNHHPPRIVRLIASALLLLLVLVGSVRAAAPDPRSRAAREAAITLAIDDVKVIEDDTDVLFTVSLSGSSPTPVSVHYQTNDGTALANDDYVPASGTLTIPANVLTGTITVSIIGDNVFEGDETFTVDLSNPVGASILDGQGVGTISNDDGLPHIQVANIQSAEGNSGPTAAVFYAVLTNPSAVPVSFDYQTVDGSATVSDADYVAASGTVTIPANSVLASFTVQVNGDPVFEPNENFSVQLSHVTGAVLSNATATCTITNDDATPVIQIDDIQVIEGNSGTTPAVFTVRLTNPTYQTVTMQYANTNIGTAVPGQDFIETSGDVAIPAKASSATITVLVRGDTDVEDDEWLLLLLGNPVNASLAYIYYGRCTITNDDGPPFLTIESVKVVEGNSGVTPAVLTVHRTGTTTSTVTVDWHTTDGSALAADGDYQPASGTLAIPPDQSSGTITVLVNGDVNPELDENFTVDLSNAHNASIQAPSGSVTISDDDLPPRLSIGSVKVVEGNGDYTPVVLTVHRDGVTTSTVTVDWHTSDGSAVNAANDYVSGNGTLTIPPSQTSVTITVYVIGDSHFEPDESFTVELSNAVNASILDGSGTVTISNDDLPPNFSISGASVVEGTGGTTSLVFTVTLNPVLEPTTVAYHTADSTAAVADQDYIPTSGFLTFVPGFSISHTITVTVNSDNKPEPDEAMLMVLDFFGGPISGVGTILNDDSGPAAVPPGETITAFALGRPTPNPSTNGQPVSIEYTLPKAVSIRVSMVDVQGREVAVLASGLTPPGRHQVTWNGNREMPGLYFVRYQFPGGRAQVQRLVLMR